MEFAILIPKQFIQTFQDNAKDCSIHELFFASQSKATLQSRKPWLVRQVLFDDDGLWSEASEMGCVEEFSDRCANGSMLFKKLPRLWKPDPLVRSYILPMLKGWILDEHTQNSTKEKDTAKSIGLVLDLGSGAGRDICYLAEELKEFQHSLLQQTGPQNQCTKSIQFVGIDNHKGSAKRCVPLWKNRSVDDITHSYLLDLKKLHSVRDHFMDASKLLPPQKMTPPEIICIFAIRYLNRKLLSYIANSLRDSGEPNDNTSIQSQATAKISKKAMQQLPPAPPLILPLGTIVAISHFCKSEDGASWIFDHPKEANVLERHELSNMFGDPDNARSKHRWAILKDDIVLDGDHGRTLIQFVAKKVA